MKKAHCSNMNHSKSNVRVRYCPTCGEILKKSIPKANCSDEVHAARLKHRNAFCVDCGKSLFKG